MVVSKVIQKIMYLGPRLHTSVIKGTVYGATLPARVVTMANGAHNNRFVYVRYKVDIMQFL